MTSKVFRILTLFLILWLFLGWGAARAQNVLLTVVSNQKSAPVQLKQSELKSIMMGEQQRWRNGHKITIALMKTNTLAGRYTCQKIYNMSEDQLKKFWLGQVFGGKASPPNFFNSVDELMAFVAENPGAIGVVDMTVPVPGTQVVLIDGKRSF